MTSQDDEGKLYYFLSSPGVGTNLQLYSLRQAWRCWQELSLKKDHLGKGRIRERCVLIVDLLGLSLSQLLGQNAPQTSESIPPPRRLLPLFLDRTDIPGGQKKDLINRFYHFMEVYDDCRHFGPPKHQKLDNLDLNMTGSFINLTIEIWDIVMRHHRVGQGLFRSIYEILAENKGDEEYS